MSPTSEHERHAQFLRHYAESEVALHTFVRSLVPTRQMASEVMQDVILVLWEKFDAAADFQGWAFGVAKNVALRHLRRQSRDRHVFDDELMNQLADDEVTLEVRASFLDSDSRPEGSGTFRCRLLVNPGEPDEVRAGWPDSRIPIFPFP